jgi:hypothetical protein
MTYSGMLRRVALVLVLVLVRTTRRNIPEDGILHRHSLENLRSNVTFLIAVAVKTSNLT